jgi:glycosyltransferase involved in cell wall biosynthesis
MTKVSIIVPTFNKLLRLKLVLKSLEPQITDEVEVIVVFDGCDPEMIEKFQQLSFSFTLVQVICKNNVGRATARNRGIERSKGEIIIFLDDDRVVSPTFICGHLEMHEQVGKPAVVFGTRNEFYLSDVEIEAYGNSIDNLEQYCEEHGDIQKYLIHDHHEKGMLRWLNFYTGNVSVSREVLLKAGCFDENFKKWGHEDIDLGIRLTFLKVRFFYANYAANYHMMHPSNFYCDKKLLDDNLRYMIRKYRGHPVIQLFLTVLREKQKRKGVHINQTKIFEKKENKVKSIF